MTPNRSESGPSSAHAGSSPSPTGDKLTTHPASPNAQPGRSDAISPAPQRAPARGWIPFLSRKPSDPAQHADSFREIVETVVFVVVLVLMLKSFAAEAFVIPTGSMAETLWGYQKEVKCPMCEYVFPVNTSGEVEKTPPDVVEGCVCPNCRYQLSRKEMPDGSNTGDRVLVAKFFYDLFNHQPDRLDVVVFKYPKEPQPDYTPMNYIKRCVGLSGETIGIYYGKLYYLEPNENPFKYDDFGVATEDVWKKENMHQDEPSEIKEWLKNRQKFKIVRKAPRHMDALKRLVHDNDHPAKDVTVKRWTGADGSTAWAESPPHGFKHAANGDQFDWLRYQHRLRNFDEKPQLITDFLGYNSAITSGVPGDLNRPSHGHPLTNWVGDLMIDCEVTVEQAEGELALELSKGVERFRASWDLATGDCTLSRIDAKGGTTPLEKKPTEVKKGTYHLRFANMDDRLVVWVDKNLPFGDGVNYIPATQRGPTKENDLDRPASIGVLKSAVTIQKLKLWRDTYYTLDPGHSDDGDHKINWSDPQDWDRLRDLDCKTIYVQPGHYLCMGDNSPESSDGRQWGLVPERLMLGRALMVYFPLGRAGRIE
jgi:signal peptidase I